MLNHIILSVIKLSIIILSVIILNVIILRVIKLCWVYIWPTLQWIYPKSQFITLLKWAFYVLKNTNEFLNTEERLSNEYMFKIRKLEYLSLARLFSQV